MYILIVESTNGIEHNICISKFKYKLANYIKSKGYYYSKKLDRYIDDRTTGIKGGSGADYKIETIKEIK